MLLYQTIALGCIGGALPDVLRLIAGRHEGAPKYLSSLYFWVSFVLLVALGGAATYAVSLVSPEMLAGSANRWISALAIGYSAPSMISKLLSEPNLPMPSGVRGAPAPAKRSLRGWWAH
jgi:hypothetical protein